MIYCEVIPCSASLTFHQSTETIHTYIVWLEVDFLGIKTDTTTLKVTRIDLKTLNMKSEPEFKTFDTIVSTKSHEYMQDEARDCV